MTDAEKRRNNIIDALRAAHNPVSASHFAAKYHVSRQIIVGDIALLRAAGHRIEATPRGYVLEAEKEREDGQLIRQVACRHTSEEMRAELYLMVDQGCTVQDVIVEHPVYGHLTGELQLSTRYDMDRFIEKCRRSDARPLSFLTEGVHLHTLLCPSEEAYERVVKGLAQMQILLKS